MWRARRAHRSRNAFGCNGSGPTGEAQVCSARPGGGRALPRRRTGTYRVGVSVAEEGRMAARAVSRQQTPEILERLFKLRENATTVSTEVIGGITTFFVMAYIIALNPIILNYVGNPDLQGKNLGPGFDQTVAMTAFCAGVLTIAMGLYANRPFAMAAGLGLNAVVAFQLVLGKPPMPWPQAMGIILMEGIVITILVLTGLREMILDAIPLVLKRAIGVGIGLFILLIGGQAGWLDSKGRLPGIRNILLVDSIGAGFGGLMGASSNTTYIESAAGVSSGARTGLASVVTGLLFLVCMFLAPVVAVIPPEATAPALVIVGFLMAGIATKINFSDIELGLPALLTVVVMPFTYSITNGVGVGFVTYVFLKAVRGKASEVHWLMWVVVAAFILYFAQNVYAGAFGIGGYRE